jgi:uncharacterized protein involved in cysteine biosynthesis
MEQLLRGIRYSWSQKGLRKYFWKPFFWTLVIYVAFMVSLRILITPHLQNWYGMTGIDWQPPAWAWQVLITFLFIFISSAVFYGINGLLSGLVWDDLSQKAEEMYYGDAPKGNTTFGKSVSDTLKRTPYSLGMSFLGMIGGFTPFGILSVWAVGKMSRIDFASPAMARRGVYYPEQKNYSARLKNAQSYQWAVGVLSLFPLVNLVCLPGCIIGATFLVRDNERALTSRSS